MGALKAPPGPEDPLRSTPADRLLPAAIEAARRAGVTRLADLTRLDRIGLPVWQAVRPMSRALSVHQGKGATPEQARLGALMEAFESDSAERFDADGPRCSFAALPAAERAPALEDFARDNQTAPSARAVHRWVAATDLGGGALFVPFDVVSLDFTRGLPSPFDRSSNGIGAGASRDEAIAVALNEIVERDALVEWHASGLAARSLSALDAGTVPFEWFGCWIERLRAAAITARFYAAPSITGAPVLACELVEPGRRDAPCRATHGFGCHPAPEIALFRALSEAIQSRVTYIAGAREDMPPSAYASEPAAIRVALALPLPTGGKGIDWRSITPGPIGLAATIARLIETGYPRIALIDIGRCGRIHAVRCFVCGLGGPARRRRPAS